MQIVIGRIIINNIHTVVVIIFNLFDFSNLKRVLFSNHVRHFCLPRKLYWGGSYFLKRGVRKKGDSRESMI